MKKILKLHELNYITNPKSSLTTVRSGKQVSEDFINCLDSTVTIEDGLLQIEADSFEIYYSYLDLLPYSYEMILTPDYMRRVYPYVMYDPNFVKTVCQTKSWHQRPMEDLFKPNKIYTTEIISEDVIFYKILNRTSVTLSNWKLML